MWSFSKHIGDRLVERSIPKQEILGLVNQEVDVLIIPSDRDRDLDLYFGYVNQKYLMLVVNRETKNLITIRKMRDKEIDAFQQELKNAR